MSYIEKLEKCKTIYPFNKWREAYDEGLEQYTEENCNKAKLIIDDLIPKIIEKGEYADEQDKLEIFKVTVLNFNQLNLELDEKFIETEKRRFV